MIGLSYLGDSLIEDIISDLQAEFYLSMELIFYFLCKVLLFSVGPSVTDIFIDNLGMLKLSSRFQTLLGNSCNI